MNFATLIVAGLCLIITGLLLAWIEGLKKWAVQFPVQWVKDFINRYLIGGWKTKLTTFVSGIAIGAGLKLLCVLGFASLVTGLDVFCALNWLTFIVCGAYVGLQNIGVFSAVRSATGARTNGGQP